MRLLNTSTFRLETFPDESKTPYYAILSHTWGDDEVLFDDVGIRPDGNQMWKTKESARKTLLSAKQAIEHGLDYIWIDTICIDKRSSAELSESINSMFNWYKRSTVCYVYLADVRQVEDIDRCRWLCRGWTLQELIAPRHVVFYSQDWSRLGSRNSLSDKLMPLTGIGQELLYRKEFFGEVEDLLSFVSIATKMSWAANRQTTRREDVAYCLMGLFGVHMPLLYGEGDKAFLRLQEEILKDTTDTSILAHQYFGNSDSLLASHPIKFGRGLTAINEASSTSLLRYSNKQITFEAMICPVGDEPKPQTYAAILDCCFEKDIFSRAVILLEPVDGLDAVFVRASKLLYFLKEPNILFRLSGAYKGVFDYIPPLRFSRLQSPGMPVQYEIVNSMPPMFDNAISQLPPREFKSRIAHGIIAFSSDSEGDTPYPLSKSSFCVTWGMWAKTEPWCRLWTVAWMRDALSKTSKRRGKYMAYEVTVDKLLDGQYTHPEYAYCLVPRLHPNPEYASTAEGQYATETLTVEADAQYPEHIITAKIKRTAFLGQSRLELSVEVEITE
ncbi:hypothetical protein PG989_004568 [Apiospora arundinis]